MQVMTLNPVSQLSEVCLHYSPSSACDYDHVLTGAKPEAGRAAADSGIASGGDASRAPASPSTVCDDTCRNGVVISELAALLGVRGGIQPVSPHEPGVPA